MNTRIQSTDDNEFGWRSGMKVLGGAIEPAHDLWPGIAARLALPARRARRRWLPFAAAASVLAAFGAGVDRAVARRLGRVCRRERTREQQEK